MFKRFAVDVHMYMIVSATSLVTYAGERYDFVIEANNEIDNYWIRFRGLMDCDERLGSNLSYNTIR